MTERPASRATQWLVSLAGFALVLGLLRSYPLQHMTRPALAAAVIALGWVAYQYLASVGLIRRHAFLSHVAREDSGFRRLFWRARVLRARLAVAAMVTAALALVLSARLATHEWAALGASILSFAALLGPVSRRCATQFVPQYRFALALRTTFWINLVLVATALAVVQVVWIEVPATHHATLGEVVSAAFAAEAARAAVPQVGWLLGLNAATSDAIWHLMQVASPAAADHRWLYVLACGLVLAWNALQLGAVWLVLLGVLALARRAAEARAAGGRVTRAGYGWGVLLVLLAGALAWQLDPRSGGPGAAPVAGADPCAQEERQLARRARGALAGQQAQFLARVDGIVDAGVERAYAQAEEGVERFLDWNFSLAGQYQQLYFLAASAAGADTLAAQVGAKIDGFVHAGLHPALEALGDEMEAELAASIAAVYRRHDAYLDTLLAGARCVDDAGPTVGFEQYMRKSLVGAGAGAGIVAAGLSARLGSRVVSRAAVARALSATAARFSGRAVAAGEASSAGALCGPLAPACVPAIGVATWLAVDLLLNAADEALNREALRAELLAVLEADKAALRQALGARYAEAAAGVFGELEAYQAARFNVARMARPRPSADLRPGPHY